MDRDQMIEIAREALFLAFTDDAHSNAHVVIDALQKAGALATGWRSIESAPIGTRILLKFAPPFFDTEDTGDSVGMQTEPGKWWLTCIWAASSAHREPTHWRPLHAPPDRQAERASEEAA